MESGTLPPPTMLLLSNESVQQISSSDSPMNSYSDIYSSRQSIPINNKTNKRKLDELVDPSSVDFDSSATLKPQKTEQVESERSLSRTGTPLSNGPQPPQSASTPSRNGNDNGSSLDFGPPSNTNNNNNNNTGSTTPNPLLLTQQTPPPPSLQQQNSNQPLPPVSSSSSFMPMSPRNQYSITSDSPFIQTNNQVFVFTTQLANEAAEAVLKNECPNIIEYHKSLPSTAQYLSSISNNMNNSHNPLMSGPMHMSHGPPPPPGCHSPRTMQMMMGGPVPHNPHLSHPNGNGGPPPNWPPQHFHPHQQQPPFGRLTPGSGGLPPPSHLMPPGALMMNGQPPSDGIENLTPERAKHRKNQLNKIEDLKTKITGGRARGGRAKAGAAPPNPSVSGNIPPPVNGGALPPGSFDPHQQQMMMMNSPHGVGPPHHMMGIGPPPPPHMLPPGMRGPDGMMLDMNGPPQPQHGYMNGPMPPNFHGQYGPGPGDPYGQLPLPHQQPPPVRDWNKMQMEHMDENVQKMRGQPPPYSSASPSSLTPPIATTSAGGGLGPNGKLLSPKLEPSGAPRLYKVGQPEKFVPDSLPSSANKKLAGNIGEVQLTTSPTQMDYNELGMEGEELIITRHLNRAYRPSNGMNNSGPPLPSSSSSSCKDEPGTPLSRSNSTPNANLNSIPSASQPLGSTTPTHISQQGSSSHLTSQNASAASPRSSKLTANSSLASPLMLSNTNTNNNSSTKDEPLDMNGGPKTPTSNMAPPLSSMLQMTNSLQSANSPYNSSNNTGSKSSSLSSNLTGNGPPMPNPNMTHMPKSMDHLSAPPHMPLPPQPHMQFQNMNPHHRMLGPPESMPPHYNPHHGGPPPPPHMYKMMPPHHALDPSGGMMLPYPGGPPRPSKGLPPPPSSDPMQQHHHLPPPHYMKMHNMDPLLGGPPPGHQQQHTRFMPMIDDGYCMGPPPPSHHPHMHPHMHPHPQMHHHPMHPNDGRPPPQPPTQSINNTYVSTTMSIQQLNIQSLGPGGPPPELQPGTIHYHASSANGPDSQQQGLSGPASNSAMFASQQQFTSMNAMPPNDPAYAPQYNDLQLPPPNLSVDGVQQPPYW